MLRLNNEETNIPGLPRVARGFTLVELMLVMGVIVIMAAMLFPVITASKDKTRKKLAISEAHNIALAISAYRSEFGKWPNQSQGATDTTYFVNNHLVIQELAGNNPRGKVFLAIQSSNQTDSVTNMVDPWGVPYVICMDENDDANCFIYLKNIGYTNQFKDEKKIYSATNYWVSNQQAAVASFTGRTNPPFQAET